ncbi:MAG: tripartite tricarboxylate transporter substrate binding protein [Betaproteobacteria bacterium]|nr:tripartite tricarboxylate transporter substrate binding protein [Betaproteobacteria bacterium]
MVLVSRVAVLTLVIVWAVSAGPAFAQSPAPGSSRAAAGGTEKAFPAKPIRFIVGPGPDVLARMVGQKLTDRWGQQVVVDQRPGAGGIIAADTAAKAAPDGYTLLLTTGAYTVNAVFYSKLPYDLARDLAPVSLLASIQFLLVVHPSVAAKSVAELIRLARAKPGQLNCASSGTGTTAHLGCEMLKGMGRIDIVHVPYKGLAPAISEVLGGQVEMLFAVMQAGLPHVRAGKLRALAVSGTKRALAAPDLPTVAEAGVPEFAFDSWNGVHVPARTPKALIATLNAEMVNAIKLPDVRGRMLDLGLEPVGSTPEDFAAFVRTDIARWARVIKDAGVRTE